jgi:hypothetical protein
LEFSAPEINLLKSESDASLEFKVFGVTFTQLDSVEKPHGILPFTRILRRFFSLDTNAKNAYIMVVNFYVLAKRLLNWHSCCHNTSLFLTQVNIRQKFYQKAYVAATNYPPSSAVFPDSEPHTPLSL